MNQCRRSFYSVCVASALVGVPSQTASSGENVSTPVGSPSSIFPTPLSPTQPPLLEASAGSGLPYWTEAGTLFHWGFDGEPGGPDLTEPLVTDRPDFTEASVTVGRGISQLEFGYTYGYESQYGVSTRAQSFGEPLLRHGFLADWFELRMAVFPVEERTVQAG